MASRSTRHCCSLSGAANSSFNPNRELTVLYIRAGSHDLRIPQRELKLVLEEQKVYRLLSLTAKEFPTQSDAIRLGRNGISGQHVRSVGLYKESSAAMSGRIQEPERLTQVCLGPTSRGSHIQRRELLYCFLFRLSTVHSSDAPGHPML